MSHVVTIKRRVTNESAIKAACKRLELAEPVRGEVSLFGANVSGLAVQLPQWIYPIVIDTESGEVHYDNYNEQWGEQKVLDQFLQRYQTEVVKIEATKQNRSYTETALEDGSILVTIQA